MSETFDEQQAVELERVAACLGLPRPAIEAATAGDVHTRGAYLWAWLREACERLENSARRMADLEAKLAAERQAREAAEARLYAGCQDCIYEPRNRCADQCSGCTVWAALVTAGVEHE